MAVEIVIVIPQPTDLPKGTTIVSAFSGYGSDKFRSTSIIANTLPFRHAIDFVVADHRASRKSYKGEKK